MKYFIIILLIYYPLYTFSQGNIIAHRGASSIAPENTISALETAIELECGYIEIDIRMSMDDSIMVIHDETIDRTTNGTGRVDQYNYDELKGFSAGYANKFDSDFVFEEIPTLFEMLLVAKGKIKVCIELKNVSENPVVDLVLKMQMDKDVYLLSYNIDKLINIKAINPVIRTILLKNTITSVDLDLAKDNGISGVSSSYIFANFLINKAHNFGLSYWVGIVNDPAKAERLFKKNVDAILTDFPQLMKFNNELAIKVSPNPFHESVEIQLNDVSDIQQILILNNLGSVVYEFEVPHTKTFTWKPDNNYSTGPYLIYMIKGETIYHEKILFVD